jgi:hypothetical protein
VEVIGGIKGELDKEEEVALPLLLPMPPTGDGCTTYLLWDPSMKLEREGKWRVWNREVRVEGRNRGGYLARCH